jgi:hypothetical protein
LRSATIGSVRCGVVASLWIVGCGFQPASAITDGHALDSKVVHMDARTFFDAAVVRSSLAVTVTTLGNADLDITAEGTIDWAHWGYLGATGFDRRTGGTAISNVSTSPSLSFTGAPFTATWTDGDPHANVSMTSSGAGIHAGSTLTFTVEADTALRTLRLYVGAQTAAAQLDVALSDGTPALTKMLTDATGTTNVCYAIAFNAATAGQTLTVSWTDTHDFSGGNAFAALLEATLH